MNHPKPSEAVEAVALATVNDLRETIRRKSKLKGRQADDASIAEVRQLIGEAPHRRDLLIENLHKLNDAYRALHDRHLVALAKEMNLPKKRKSSKEVYFPDNTTLKASYRTKLYLSN